MKHLPLLCAALLATSAQADTYRVVLGNKTLGHLDYNTSGTTATLRSTLDNTPLGVFNGTFLGTSTGSAATSTFTGESRSSRKSRTVIVDIADGHAQRTQVTPQKELTKLSDVTLVPAGARDPVQAMGALFQAQGCPKAMRMYDGRRFVTLSPDGQSNTGAMLTCNLRYTVTKGPGHLSPLGISSAKMQLNYDTAGGQQNLQELAVSSGPFRLRLTRGE